MCHSSQRTFIKFLVLEKIGTDLCGESPLTRIGSFAIYQFLKEKHLLDNAPSSQ